MITSSRGLLLITLLATMAVCFAEESTKGTPSEGFRIGNLVVTRQDPPERLEADKFRNEDTLPVSPKPSPEKQERQQVVFDLSEWVRAKLAVKNFTVNLDQLSLPTFDFSKPYAWHLAIYVPVVYSLIGLGYFLAFLFPGSFGLARRSDSIFSGFFGSREDDTSRNSVTTSDDTANNFDYAALESPNAYYADDYVDNAFQQAEGGNSGNNRNSRRRNRNRRQNGYKNADYPAATARMGNSFTWADILSTAISKIEQWLNK